jgi:hypothetical protein
VVPVIDEAAFDEQEIAPPPASPMPGLIENSSKKDSVTSTHDESTILVCQLA